MNATKDSFLRQLHGVDDHIALNGLIGAMAVVIAMQSGDRGEADSLAFQCGVNIRWAIIQCWDMSREARAQQDAAEAAQRPKNHQH